MGKKAAILSILMAAMAVQAATANDTKQTGVSNGEKRIEAPGAVMNDEAVAVPEAPAAAEMTAVPGPEVSREDTRSVPVQTR